MPIFRVAVIVALLSVCAAGQVPLSNHVLLLVEENHSFESVIGSPQMPYLNSLARQYGLAMNYFANSHPSIPNYFELTAGQGITRDDGTSQIFNVDNLARDLLLAGKTWKSYADGLPAAGYTGGNNGAYAKHHNPFAYFTDVAGSSVEAANLVQFSQFAIDLANGQLPNFSFIVPDLLHDAHSASLASADVWLQQNIAPLLANPSFQQDGILIITFDESFGGDLRFGGGHVATVVIGPTVRLGYQSTIFYQHQNTLRTVEQALGLTAFTGDALLAAPMADFFLPPPLTAPAPPINPSPSPRNTPDPGSRGPR